MCRVVSETEEVANDLGANVLKFIFGVTDNVENMHVRGRDIVC